MMDDHRQQQPQFFLTSDDVKVELETDEEENQEDVKYESPDGDLIYNNNSPAVQSPIFSSGPGPSFASCALAYINNGYYAPPVLSIPTIFASNLETTTTTGPSAKVPAILRRRQVGAKTTTKKVQPPVNDENYTASNSRVIPPPPVSSTLTQSRIHSQPQIPASALLKVSKNPITPSSPSIPAPPAKTNTKTTVKSNVIGNKKNNVKVDKVERQPLQPTNNKDDRAKYRDFVHCCKCFSTFYKLRDLAQHFDSCSHPYPNGNFKDYKLQQQQEEEKEACERADVSSQVDSVSNSTTTTTATATTNTAKNSGSERRRPRKPTFQDFVYTPRGFNFPYRCTFKGCNRKFSKKMGLIYHEKRMHYKRVIDPAKQIPCPDCFQLFNNKLDLRLHRKAVHPVPEPPPPPFMKCYEKTCHLLFSTHKEKVQHFRENHRDRIDRFKCPFENCGKTFKKEENLRSHSESHKDKSQRTIFVCDYPGCGAEYLSFKNLVSHKKIVHEEIPRTKDFLCPTCGKSFYSSARLKSHSLTHIEGKSCLCSICGMGFTVQNHLNRHIQVVHKGERPKKCRFCDKSFGSSGCRKRHEQTHTGFRPYQCKFCGDRFSDNRALKRHLSSQHEDCEFNLNDPPTYQVYLKPKPPELQQDPPINSP